MLKTFKRIIALVEFCMFDAIERVITIKIPRVLLPGVNDEYGLRIWRSSHDHPSLKILEWAQSLELLWLASSLDQQWDQLLPLVAILRSLIHQKQTSALDRH